MFPTGTNQDLSPGPLSERLERHLEASLRNRSLRWMPLSQDVVECLHEQEDSRCEQALVLFQP